MFDLSLREDTRKQWVWP